MIEELRAKYPSFAIFYAFASEMHKNDKRSDGKPYMTHVDAVIEGSSNLTHFKIFLLNYLSEFSQTPFDEVFPPELYSGDNLVEWVASTAALHDVFEDHRELTYDDLVAYLEKHPDSTGWDDTLLMLVWESVSRLTKFPKGEEEYTDYVQRVFDDPVARWVKIADLTHNMSNLKPGNLRDKYHLTKALLTGDIQL